MKDRLKRIDKKKLRIVGIIILILTLLLTLILVKSVQNQRVSAALPDKMETEAGVLSSSGVSKLSDSGASGGSYVLFNKSTEVSPTPQPGGPFAFPGAQGHGALAKGGRSGTVIEVTNLNNSGTGSLRACIDATGARTCVFRVAGTIRICSRLTILNPYITIAGQTSPGGIQIVAAKSGEVCYPSGSGPHLYELMVVKSHDVIIRYIRLRHGKTGITGEQNGHPLKFNNGAYNSLADHNSIYWTQDENVTIWTDSTNPPFPHNLTISYNIITEPLSGHATNTIMGGDGSASEQLINFDYHHNLFGTSTHRNPTTTSAHSFRWINNIIYNFRALGSHVQGKVWADYIGNIYKCGPASNATYGWVFGCVLAVDNRQLPSPGVRPIIWRDGPETVFPGDPSFYVKGNITKHHPNPDGADEWNLVVGQQGYDAFYDHDSGPLNPKYKRKASDCPGCSDWAPLPYEQGVPKIIPESALTLENTLGLGTGTGTEPVGASRRLDCLGNWVDAYDSVDKRVINEYKTKTGPVDPPEDGVPAVITGVAACADSDKDGMPDAYEDANGFNKNNSSDATQITSDGYSKLEYYLNGK